jgi:hypothetical protein
MDCGAAWLLQSVAGNQPAALLERRGRLALSVKLPAIPCSGLKREDAAVYVGSVQPSEACRKAPQAVAARAAGMVCAPQQHTSTSRQVVQQPAKRSRWVSPATVAPQRRALERSASAPTRAAPPVPPVAPVVIPMPSRIAGSGISSFNIPCKDAAPQRPSSPLVAWLRRLKGLMSPARQQAIVLAVC